MYPVINGKDAPAQTPTYALHENGVQKRILHENRVQKKIERKIRELSENMMWSIHELSEKILWSKNLLSRSMPVVSRVANMHLNANKKYLTEEDPAYKWLRRGVAATYGGWLGYQTLDIMAGLGYDNQTIPTTIGVAGTLLTARALWRRDPHKKQEANLTPYISETFNFGNAAIINGTIDDVLTPDEKKIFGTQPTSQRPRARQERQQR